MYTEQYRYIEHFLYIKSEHNNVCTLSNTGILNIFFTLKVNIIMLFYFIIFTEQNGFPPRVKSMLEKIIIILCIPSG